MKQKITSTILFLGATALLLAPVFTASADVASATSYLNSKTAGPWSSMALAAAGQTPNVDYLKGTSGTKAIDLEAPILAIAAAGKDPSTFPATDLVAALKGYYSNGQIGDATTLNDDIFGVLALSAAGLTPSDTVISGTRSFILSHQGSDGGWAFSIGGGSDTNTTAAAIMALVDTGSFPSSQAITNAINYLKSAQNSDGGFPYDPVSQWGTSSDASSDAWVISALNKVGTDPRNWTKGSSDPISNLLTFQTQLGYFQFQAGTGEDSFSPVTTSYAVVALSGKFYPVGKVSASAAQGVSVTYRIEGSGNEICSGSTVTVTAMDVVKQAGAVCNFTYNIQTTSYGPYLNQIGSDTAQGPIGWLYMVNYVSPSIGAADYNLQSGDTVLWFFGDYSWKPSRILATSTQVSSGGAVSVTAESLEQAGWTALGGAAIHAGSSSATTDSSGKATLNLPDGNYTIFAAKNGYVRSNSQLVMVGESSQTTINLSATISGSGQQQNQNTVSFTVDTGENGSSVAFGSLSAGTVQKKNVVLKNSGQTNISVVSTLSGDDVFLYYLTIDNMLWNMFNTVIAPSGSKTSELELSIPQTYDGSGAKNGALVFWATPIQ